MVSLLYAVHHATVLMPHYERPLVLFTVPKELDYSLTMLWTLSLIAGVLLLFNRLSIKTTVIVEAVLAVVGVLCIVFIF